MDFSFFSSPSQAEIDSFIFFGHDKEPLNKKKMIKNKLVEKGS